MADLAGETGPALVELAVGDQPGADTVRGTATGTLLANLLAGKRENLTDFLLAAPKPSWNPPQPALSLGVNFTLRTGQARAGLEA